MVFLINILNNLKFENQIDLLLIIINWKKKHCQCIVEKFCNTTYLLPNCKKTIKFQMKEQILNIISLLIFI